MKEKVSFPARVLDTAASAGVVVVGGGTAGIAAAVAAARNGAETLLIEQSGCCGGMAARGLLTSIICMTDGKDVLANGICREFVERITADMKLAETSYRWQNIHPESVKRAADMMLAEAGARVLYETVVTDCAVENGTVTALRCFSPCGGFAVTGKIFIDCTGDANLAALAGVPFEYGDEEGKVMAPTLCVMYDNISYPDDRCNGIGRREWSEAEKNHELPVDEHHFVGFFRNGEGCGAGNLGHIYGTDVLDIFSRSEAWTRGRALARRYHEFFRDKVAGFAKSGLTLSADMLGVRESRRIAGEYQMTSDDYFARRHFDDDIGSFAYPVDIHASGGDAEKQAAVEKKIIEVAYAAGENYGIPYRALLPKNTKNLLAAGRCISTDRAMQSSIRVVPGCMITGEAAGTAAAMTLSKGCSLRTLDVSSLQKRLVEQGAVIKVPPFPPDCRDLFPCGSESSS
ncbi:MAG: FAD-dependent oxidoreductase [Lentisphaeria bacterium]|nr:FAD-dependent oxidoreductase [Lentisphaeria bacterium]